MHLHLIIDLLNGYFIFWEQIPTTERDGRGGKIVRQTNKLLRKIFRRDHYGLTHTAAEKKVTYRYLITL